MSQSSVEGELEELAAGLESTAERLADLALDRLREAADPDGTDPQGAAALERRITRARRAVEKAVTLLQAPRQPDGP